ncbi:MAG: hypothetical protein ACJA08_001795 [Cyclobacteriaceae bacterium]|jgi:hypothetical protein
MIYETTYSSHQITIEINKIVGEAYSFLDRFKLNGIGSKRMPISSISPEFTEYLKADHYITYANIELRPKGIIIHFRYKLESYCWPMAYDKLVVETEPNLTLRSKDKFITFKDGLMLNGKFVDKLIHIAQQ